MIMVDPKQLELSIYEGIPHLLLPVVCDPKKAALALHWAVEEMERRYTMMAELGVRNLAGYNERIKELPPEDLISKEGQEFVHLPYIVILIDEFADLMMVASKEIETFVARLAQKARAAGIHLILATHRPSVDVITGTIKANFPSRISFQVSSGHDAKTILDTVGSEHLLGMGDMLYMSAGGFGLTRVHGALVTEKEIDKVVAFLKAQGEPQYDESILEAPAAEGGDEGEGQGERQLDEMYDKAIAFVAEKQKVSISLLQRYLGIGYNRSARIVEQMEKDGIVGPANGSKPREVLVPPPPEGGY
jgi:S-DNA-T family DNA segregation ATPase FtsK/SpoIIIE